MIYKLIILHLFFYTFIANLFSQAVGDYISISSGTWSTPAIWQTWNGTSWVATGVAPTSANGVITIQSPNVVTVSAAVTIDQVIINSGATLQSSGAVIVTIANTAGIQLQINGTFIDGSSASISWGANASWAFGINGTLIKTTGNSSATWQTKYSGGASTMPSTANWILRKTTAANPTIVSIGAFYPNLTIESNFGAWNTVTTSTFNGAGFPTIKGNFDLGGTGSGTVTFLNNQSGATPTTIIGNTTIRAGNTFNNYGTGIEIQGNLTVDGTINYILGTGTRGLTFSGGNAQTFSGIGTCNIYKMTINKSGNSLTLNRPITIDNVLTLTLGLINSTLINLPTINTAGSVVNTNNLSFVNGPIRYIGSSAFTFPVGKGTDYQPLSYSATAGGGVFWTETFSNSCSSDCPAAGYAGPNGAWTVTDNSPALDACGYATSPNTWYVSGAECGNAAGACGTSCGTTDPSLHIGSTTMGDMGASFDAGGWCDYGLGGWGSGTQTDIRIESPTISCSGQSNITLSFNYIENGQTTLDDATLWYFDGTSWSQIANTAKVVLCGGQGTWTAYSIVLPASANNNANVKIGFRWVNNDDGSGTDPSFAVDDITLSTSGATVDFTCEYFYANPQLVAPCNNTIVPTLNHISSCEYWVLNRNAGTASKTVTLSWDINSCGITSLADLRIARCDGVNTWQDEGNTLITGNLTLGTISSGVVTSFSPFTLASSSLNNPLPVELVSFTAIYNGKIVVLNWETASEQNSEYFTVQRSTDGNNFLDLEKVNSVGNSSVKNNYYIEDKEPKYGISYYRLKQVDFDGKISFFQIVPVKIEKENDIIIENLFVNNKTIILNVNCYCENEINIEILDITGRNVYSKMNLLSSHSEIIIDAGNFSKGIYFLKINNGYNNQSKKFVITK